MVMGWCSHRWLCCFVVFLLVVCAADLTECKVHYYIAPSNASCSQYPHCLTLSQFAADSDSYIGNDVNVSLSILPGNHTLDIELNVAQLDNFLLSMEITLENDTKVVIIECTYQSGRFVISDTTSVLIKGLHFIGCSGNTVSHMDNLILNGTIFQGVEGNITGRVLELNMVASATVVGSSFLFNSNTNYHFYDGVILIYGSSFTITNSVISNNGGNFMFVYESSCSIINSTFTNHRAIRHNISTESGVPWTYIRDTIIGTELCSADIINSTFNNNTGHLLKLSSYLFDSSSMLVLTIIASTFTNNSGPVVYTCGNLTVNITDSNFISNVHVYAYDGFDFISSDDLMGALLYFGCTTSLIIAGTNFIHNTAAVIVLVCQMDGNLFNSTFVGNYGCTIATNNYCSIDCTCTNDVESVTTFVTSNSIFKENDNSRLQWLDFVHGFIGFIHILRASFRTISSSYEQNMGSFYTIQSTIVFSDSRFESCLPELEPFQIVDGITQEGGAITSYQSNIMFNGEISLSNNTARQGGAILATESTIMIQGDSEVIIANNTATNGSGGGVYLQQSRLEIKGKCTISNNYAVRGGGIYATSSSIIIYENQNVAPTLQLINNSAEQAGGGAYLQVNPRLTLMRARQGIKMLIFLNNHANYGGAMYVADETSSLPCTSNKECFVQAMVINDENTNAFPSYYYARAINFSGNTAFGFGSNLFGGLLDRCSPSPYAGSWLIYNIFQHTVTSNQTLLPHYPFEFASATVITCLTATTCFPLLSKQEKERLSLCPLLQLIKLIILWMPTLPP